MLIPTDRRTSAADRLRAHADDVSVRTSFTAGTSPYVSAAITRHATDLTMGTSAEKFAVRYYDMLHNPCTSGRSRANEGNSPAVESLGHGNAVIRAQH